MQKVASGNAFLIQGAQGTLAAVLEYLKRTGIEIRGNPDLYARSYREFGINDARDLRDRVALGAFGDSRTFVIETPGMTNEAQNALLKTLEEPAGNASFYIIVPAPHTMLATIRSRTQMLTIEATEVISIDSVDVGQFLLADPVERIEMLKPLLEKGDDDKRDTGAILAFISALEVAVSNEPMSATTLEKLRAIYRARRYLGDKGALVKPLLEQVALLI